MTQPTFNAYGAVDLGALAARAQARAATPPPAAATTGEAPAGGGGGWVVDVTEADFAEVVLAQSETVPVVLDFWADWCGPCRQLSPVLERLAEAGGGRWLLAKIDADAEQRLAAAFRVQSIPSVFAVVRGQPVPLFQGALPPAQVEEYIDQLLQLAAANGVTGVLPPTGTAPAAVAAEPEPVGDPRLDAAYDAAEAGDFGAAAEAFRKVLAETPGLEEAVSGLAQVELLDRAAGLDQAAVLAAAAQDPGDVAAALDAADLEMACGDPERAMQRLVDAVARSAGKDRDAARGRLLELFALVGADDPRVVAARRALARALF
ncbi:putative thioredoxin [Motilibacter rhizosphaerae]|uniref:Putative thioredoxin n=1 Tax=Motilibacter rhizosphaerae TaxID=598652 RepID=A0A4Q7NPH8_9ACTN|nr:tetratricopeptide repeat protein [Motilibacter rhizosphaerae]RZS87083.1 putative thioredoxin [Motilibacter rhizosphaerae]